MRQAQFNYLEFMTLMEELMENFGKKYKDKQLVRWYDRLKYFPYDCVKAAVDDLCLRSIHLPSFQQLEELTVSHFRSKNHSPAEPFRYASNAFCHECHDSGLVETRRIGSPAAESNWLFKCDCAAGLKRVEVYPIWQAQDRNRWKKLPIEALEARQVRKMLNARGISDKEGLISAANAYWLVYDKALAALNSRYVYFLAEKKQVPPEALITAMLETKDITNISLLRLRHMAKFLVAFQQMIIVLTYGSDKLDDRSNDALMQNLVDFCKKFEIKNNLLEGPAAHA